MRLAISTDELSLSGGVLRRPAAAGPTGARVVAIRRAACGDPYTRSVIRNTGSTATTFSDTGLTPSTTYVYTVDAYNAAGSHSAQSAPASATTSVPGSVQHYEYVFPADAIDVYDMYNGMRLVKTITLPGATDIRGAVASPATHTLYVSYGGDGGPNGNGSMLAYNLLTDAVVWTRNYSAGVDSMAITPDGKTIYMPTGEAASGGNWDIVDASTGNVTGSINGKATLAFTTATGYLGFQVSDITTGKVVYTVPIQGNFPYTPGQAGPSSPSHGISLSPMRSSCG